jgi:hypothetical protein
MAELPEAGLGETEAAWIRLGTASNPSSDRPIVRLGAGPARRSDGGLPSIR